MIGLEARQNLARNIHAAQQAGARLKLACATAGIDVRTLQRWKARDGLVAGDGRPAAQRPVPAHALSPAERAEVLRVANEVRFADVPPARINVPVVTIHTLGDVYVPFSMEQIYKRRAMAQGTDKWLVQRAIRGVSHCDFTVEEQASAFDAMALWDQKGVKPEGDEVLDRATVAHPHYGCKFSSRSRTPNACPAS